MRAVMWDVLCVSGPLSLGRSVRHAGAGWLTDVFPRASKRGPLSIPLSAYSRISVVYVKNKLSWPGVEKHQDYIGNLNFQRIVASEIWGIYQSAELLLGDLKMRENSKYQTYLLAKNSESFRNGACYRTAAGKSVSFENALQLSP